MCSSTHTAVARSDSYIPGKRCPDDPPRQCRIRSSSRSSTLIAAREIHRQHRPRRRSSLTRPRQIVAPRHRIPFASTSGLDRSDRCHADFAFLDAELASRSGCCVSGSRTDNPANARAPASSRPGGSRSTWKERTRCHVRGATRLTLTLLCPSVRFPAPPSASMH